MDDVALAVRLLEADLHTAKKSMEKCSAEMDVNLQKDLQSEEVAKKSDQIASLQQEKVLIVKSHQQRVQFINEPWEQKMHEMNCKMIDEFDQKLARAVQQMKTELQNVNLKLSIALQQTSIIALQQDNNALRQDISALEQRVLTPRNYTKGV